MMQFKNRYKSKTKTNGNEHEMQPAFLAPDPAGISIILELVIVGIIPYRQKAVAGSEA